MVHPFALQLSLGLPDSRNGPDKDTKDHHLLKHACSQQRKAEPSNHESLPYLQDLGKTDYTGMVKQISRERMSAHGSSNQLTVFYGGTVNVYDNVPADKVQAIMSLAGSGKPWSEVHSAAISNPTVGTHGIVKSSVKRPPTPPPELHKIKAHQILESRSLALNNFPSAQMFQVPDYCEPRDLSGMLGPCQPMVPKALPIARKESLARFLKKRKERVLAAPYIKRPMQEGVFNGNNSPLFYSSHLGTSGQRLGSERMFYGNAGVAFPNMGFQDPNWLAENSKQVSECGSRT